MSLGPPAGSPRSARLWLVLRCVLCATALLGLGSRCDTWRFGIHVADVGGGLRLEYWALDAERVSETEREVTIAGRLLVRGRHPEEVIVLAASRDPDLVVLDGALRFPERRHWSWPGVGGHASGDGGDPAWPPGAGEARRDTLRIRLPAHARFDPASLVFTALDRFGGALDVASAATGRFRVEEIDGRWWFVTPAGHGFFSAGVSQVSPGGDFSPPLGRSPYHDNILALYGSEEGWAEVTEERLRAWGFNTLGAWSRESLFSESLPHTPVLSLNRAAPAVPGWPTGQTGQAIRDYFDPAFDAGLALRIEGARDCAENPWCIGIFTDNELPWGVSVLQRGTYVDAYLTLPPGAPGKLALQSFFEERYGDVAAMNAAWSLDLSSFDDIQQLEAVEADEPYCNAVGRRADRQAFVARVAARYFERVHAALRGAFPDLLILGPRFLGVYTSPEIVAAAAPYVDVVSVNDYDWDDDGRGLFRSEGRPYGYLFLDDPLSDLETLHEISNRPVMVTEWTWRTPTPEVDVLFPPFIPTVDTQQGRADEYEAFMNALLERPYMVGSHWFKYFDQPATGRGDGENSLFGVVDIEDTPYPELSERMTSVNADLIARHRAGPTESSVAGLALASAVPGDAALGQRVFSVAPSGERSGFFIHILPGVNLARAVMGGPLRIDAGAPDSDGVASLSLAEDVVLSFETVVNDLACLRFEAAGSHGELACDGGFGHDVSVTQAGGPNAPPPVSASFLGGDAGPGAATLLLPMQFTRLPAGAVADDCLSAAYPPPVEVALTTGTVTSTKGSATFETPGENFVCGPDGDDWRREDGQGMLVVGVPIFDSRVPGGNLAAAFRVADRLEACLD
jgi:hypothetical protein